MKRILYLGNSNLSSTSAHRAYALKRLGHDVIIKDPYHSFPLQLKTKWIDALHYRTGYRIIQRDIAKWTTQIIENINDVDLVWVDSGELLGVSSIKIIKKLNCPIILYNNDDPTGNRDGRKFDMLLKAIPYYDLCVLRVEKTENELLKSGAKKIYKIYMSYDEIAHKPLNNHDIPDIFKSQVAFIGTWMRYEKRDEFLLKLIENGLPLSIWGDRWKKSPFWQKLKPFYKGGALSGKDYVSAIQGADICIGMVSNGNRDYHTRRSLEIPYIGGVLCAMKTPIHNRMYKEWEEAVFWSDASECIEVCKTLLKNHKKREGIRIAGMNRVRKLGLGNENICKAILNVISNPSLSKVSSFSLNI